MQNEMASVKQESDSSPNNNGNREAGSRNACSPTDELADNEEYSALTFCQIFIKEEPYDAGVLEEDSSTLQKKPVICHSINRTSDQSNETKVAELEIDGSNSIFPEGKFTEPNDEIKIEERFG
ncbi:uncharacterized protein LOC111059896 isoform X2 [Nilaparvata lugens]|uniref:uncharacterized protein LOC111059896 isoform X2 n=1 Tax=Nilaparvata lugens TaxID=108931 RepID=UPI00193D2066|nr:uncharacterized protein LOC111059896 isoform X2 [Nilaparvata lugens]